MPRVTGLLLGKPTPGRSNSTEGVAGKKAGRRFCVGSLQLGVLRLCFFQSRDVGVGVFPEGEEIFVGGKRPDAGGIGIRSLRGSRLHAKR